MSNDVPMLACVDGPTGKPPRKRKLKVEQSGSRWVIFVP
jgi:hypothetical protein